MTTAPAPHLLRNMLWIGFFVAILLAWWWLYAMAQMMGVDVMGRPTGMAGMGDVPPVMADAATGTMAEGMATGDSAEMGADNVMMGADGGMPMAAGGEMTTMAMTTFRTLFPMWAIMMAAMMLPTMVPTLRTYETLMVSANGTRAGWLGVLLGYSITWVGFAGLIALAQIFLLRAGVVDAMGIAASPLVAAGLLMVVGLYQFSRTKAVCHGACHSPMSFFLGRWEAGFAGGLRMGLALGGYCVGCCWGFMALGFVGGVMSLLWMGLATLFMVFEKLPDIGHRLTRPAGVALILAGLGLAANSL